MIDPEQRKAIVYLTAISNRVATARRKAKQFTVGTKLSF
jgi:hypothetical protein